MIEKCPHCSMVLRFSQAHREKLASALENLPEGKSLKFGCPGCKTPIELDKSGQAVGKPSGPNSGRNSGRAADQGSSPGSAGKKGAPPVAPPGAPDISWLDSGEKDEEKVPDDVPMAMVLVDDGHLREKTAAGLADYQVVIPEGPEEAVERMRFKTFEVVVFFSGYGGGQLETQEFHRFMMNMSMKKRRKIFYIVVGPEFHTLYDLEALTLSANLVVNTDQMDHFPALVKKGMKTYDELFGPYKAALKHYGKN